MDGKEENKEKKDKISLAEIILVGLVLAAADVFEGLSIIAAPIPVIGQTAAVFSVAVGTCIALMVQFYLTMRGVKALWFMASSVFPVRTIAWLLVSFFANNPRVKKIADKVGGGAIPIKI